MKLRIGLIQLTISIQTIRPNPEKILHQLNNDPERFLRESQERARRLAYTHSPLI